MSSPANPVTSDRSLEFPVDNGEARIGEPPFRQVLVRKFSRRVGYRQRLVMSLYSDGRSGEACSNNLRQIRSLLLSVVQNRAVLTVQRLRFHSEQSQNGYEKEWHEKNR